MRKSSFFIWFLTMGLTALLSVFLHAFSRHEEVLSSLERQAALVGDLGLTDLCLFTEARYTRHLSQADFHSAFQDSPLSLEHFPSGSLLAPPKALRERHAEPD